MSFTYARRMALALALLATAGCTIHDTPPPPLTGPSVPGGVIVPVPSQSPTPIFTFFPVPPVVNAPVLFDASTSLAGEGASQISNYSWNFGDGASGNGTNITHSFSAALSFAVTLTVTNDRGQVGSLSKTVTVTAPEPKADFVFSPTSPRAGDVVNFVSTSTTPSGAAIVSYSWNFGDGVSCPGVCGTGTQSAPNHQYLPATLTGTATSVTTTYNVILTVRDANNQTSIKIVPVNVSTP